MSYPHFPEPGQVLHSPRGWSYDVHARIGGGHFGAVFDCIGPFEQPFAIKVMMPASRPYDQVRQEWLEEARRLWQLRHPNIVYVHDYFELDGLFYLVLERCDHSLEPMLGTPLTDRLIIALSRQILFAMQYLIDQDVVHNDIHAGNILIVHGKEPVPKFSDFGIAQDLYGRAGVRPPIVNNRIMAPEVALGGYSTAQSDLYQLGLLMFTMHTGQPPLDLEGGYDEVIRQIREGVPRRRAEALGTALGAVISVLLRRHEQYRYNSPAQVWEELSRLDAWRAPAPITSRAPLTPPVTPRAPEVELAARSDAPRAIAPSQSLYSDPVHELPTDPGPLSVRGGWGSPLASQRVERAAPLIREGGGGAGPESRAPVTPRAPITPRTLPEPELEEAPLTPRLPE